jgi:bifunctional ADP-heptose synthase (sugar kinase/adenylyltransferase)
MSGRSAPALSSAELSAMTIDDGFVSPGKRTILKTRIIAGQQQLCRLDRESARENYQLDINANKDLIADKVRAVDAVVFSDYAKGVVSGPLIDTGSGSGKEEQNSGGVRSQTKRQRPFRWRGYPETESL